MPETTQESAAWLEWYKSTHLHDYPGKAFHYRALDTRVLAVAVMDEPRGQSMENLEWAAYIGAVRGGRHEHEWSDVARKGCKLPKEVAAAIFPEIAKAYTWRR